MKKHGHIGVNLFVLTRSIPFLLREDVWDVPRGRLLLAYHIRGSLLHTLWLFGRLLSLHCAFHLRLFCSQSDINDNAWHVSLYHSLSYVWGDDTFKTYPYVEYWHLGLT